MKLTSSRIVNRVLIGSFVLIALFVALQFVDYLLSRKFEAEEVKHGDERRKYSQALREWIRAEPPDGSFSVLIPQRPVLLTNLIQNPSGQHISIQLGCVDRGGRSTYIAAYTEFPTNADLSNREAIYASAHSHFADKLGELRRERPVTLQDILGRETEVALRDGTNLMIGRVFIADRRLYQVTAVMPLSQGPTTNTWRFLESLRLNTNSALRR